MQFEKRRVIVLNTLCTHFINWKRDVHDSKDLISHLIRHDFNISRPLALMKQGMDSVQ